jgi:two-component system, OmpR family, sensor kinase
VSLRVRLLTVIAILVAIYIATAVVVVSTQRSLLIEQMDKRLRSVPPGMTILAGPPPQAGSSADSGPTVTQEIANPLSEIFVAFVDVNGNVRTMATGPLVGAIPDVAAAVRATNGTSGIVTVRAINDPVRFRALVTPQPDLTSWVVAAQSLSETDAAVARLVRTLWIAGAVIAVVLGVAWFWVQRLGLLPIARVTAAAEAIAGGDRAHRVEVRDERTEAGKLGVAFNVMLDERDVTETRLRQFVADASHELRTPLTSIRGYLELYRQDAFPEKAQLDDVVRRLSAESVRMYGLVEDLMVLASLDEDRPLRHDVVDLGQVLRDAAQDAQAVQTAREITVSVPETGLTMVGDSGLLIQLTGILVSNALAHTPVTAPVRLSVTREVSDAVIEIADEGPGLETEAAARVFDRFWRGESGRARGRRGGGAGLGLAIARSIVEAHRGTISLETAPGAGSTFTVRLPTRG